MALTVVEPAPVEPECLPPPPAVVVTPCDPWPRPYFLDSGLRRIQPYHFTYNTFCKERWRGHQLLHIFSSEFRDRPGEYYVSVLIIFGPSLLMLRFLERCHRNWQSRRQWPTGRYRSYREKWRSYLTYSS